MGDFYVDLAVFACISAGIGLYAYLVRPAALALWRRLRGGA